MAYDLAAIVRKQYDTFNAHDPVKLGEILAGDFAITIVPFGMTMKGKDAMADFGRLWFTAFPDANVRVNNVITMGDWVVTEWEATGTHKGMLRTPFADIPATGKPGKVLGTEVLRFKDGKLVESRFYLDALGMLLQLGVLPAKFAATRPEISPEI